MSRGAANEAISWNEVPEIFSGLYYGPGLKA
jgi:hypothetical protein